MKRKSLIMSIVRRNRNQDSPLGDLCSDLLDYREFLLLIHDTTRLSFIKFLPNRFGSHLDEPVAELLLKIKNGKKRRKKQNKERKNKTTI
ncbi:MAG: hypothetical protein VB122_07735 [Erysipelotrichales bacterium]|nr:hypothetical protein [Erysipelotrichales bacterium]